LDDFFWPYTTWYALTIDQAPVAIALLYTGQALPTLLALSEPPAHMSELLESILHLMPQDFYAHFSPGLEHIFQDRYELLSHGEHYKMALQDLSTIKGMDCAEVIRLSASDLHDITQLYTQSYPGNWFDSRMLATQQYFGIRQDNALVSIAGIHVYSETYRVAALGNITTHPAWRNKGLGALVTARLCQSLSENVDHIGLNVKADNQPAIACYQKLGFKIIASYGEFMVHIKRPFGSPIGNPEA
jgi:GNAT superfamily N-acetyltransferase